MILQIDYSVIIARVPPLGIHRKLLFMRYGEPGCSDGHTITPKRKGGCFECCYVLKKESSHNSQEWSNAAPGATCGPYMTAI